MAWTPRFEQCAAPYRRALALRACLSANCPYSPMASLELMMTLFPRAVALTGFEAAARAIAEASGRRRRRPRARARVGSFRSLQGSGCSRGSPRPQWQRPRKPSASRTPIRATLVEISSDGAKLAEAIAAYERLLRRHGQAGLLCRAALCGANQTDPARAKFYGDISEKLTAIATDLYFRRARARTRSTRKCSAKVGLCAGFEALRSSARRPA